MRPYFERMMLLVFFAMIANCTSHVIRAYNPTNEKDKKNFGLVAFGFYVYNPEMNGPFGIGKLLSKDSGTVYTYLTSDSIKFSEVILKDGKGNVVTANPYPMEAPTIMEKVGSTQYYEGKKGYIEPFYLLLSVDPKKEYLISRVTYTYQINCGQNCQRTIVRDFPLDSNQSFKSFPIRAKAGEITFGGIIMAKVIRTTKENPYGLIDDAAGITELFSGNKVAIVFEPGEGYIKSMDSNFLRKVFYNDISIDKVDKKNAEKLFYEKLSKAYPDGFWKKLAETKQQAFSK
ncbi:hypothetical protein EHO60_08370 [Leptospira fletcheri]|uniref:Lipoprotein n=1 Tax=Leptospira fletcheri TaxID=2484981 RepID=A0A4R9GJH8_9LEPT|nr:hypothetical protein [Leptospira fletcheri]TGK12263.1 hypothetical protein EHO60_08370 [Leptospira fletcheri]